MGGLGAGHRRGGEGWEQDAVGGGERAVSRTPWEAEGWEQDAVGGGEGWEQDVVGGGGLGAGRRGGGEGWEQDAVGGGEDWEHDAVGGGGLGAGRRGGGGREGLPVAPRKSRAVAWQTTKGISQKGFPFPRQLNHRLWTPLNRTWRIPLLPPQPLLPYNAIIKHQGVIHGIRVIFCLVPISSSPGLGEG